ncbi:DUF4083 domain-containing protein [Metabacillus niabensis]|uniref:Cytochrome bd-type quinol oxidase subunit 1 n=1 Tax=Metabacillus niabensis TaxID=324854 RepID=A0ABT9Z7G2_9BACI|nr:DUF4083 domain-containing protein [Metabacillus niabensis]MDQ0227940.1 cytochrome bd-type quinol oxidase subunit 1 [Metabacillus niabensis]
MNTGDLIFQLLMFMIIFCIFFAVFFLVRSLVAKKPDRSKNIEEKLDRIIELLEKDKGE